MRHRAGWNKAATARVAPATAQLGGWAPIPPNLPKHQHYTGVDGAQQGREQPIDDRAVDEPVDVVQAVAQHGNADCYRNRQEPGRCDNDPECGWGPIDNTGDDER